MRYLSILTCSVLMGLTSVATADSLPFAAEPVIISPKDVTRIEAENYDRGGEGVAYHDTTPENRDKAYRLDERVDLKRIFREPAKIAVAGTVEGEWLNYTIKVVRDGKYRLSMRTSRPPDEQPGRVLVTLDGVKEEYLVRGQGGYNRFQDASYGIVNLSAGEQILRIEFLSNSTSLDWIQLEPVDTSADTVSTTVPAIEP